VSRFRRSFFQHIARAELREKEKSPQIAGFDESLQVVATALLPKRGLGKSSATSFLSRVSEKTQKPSGAKFGASFDTQSDTRLQALIAHWANLPEALRESVFRQVCETLILQNLPSNNERILYMADNQKQPHTYTKRDSLPSDGANIHYGECFALISDVFLGQLYYQSYCCFSGQSFIF